MSHEIATTASGQDAIAYVGETPWHGLGQALLPGASIEEWTEASGLNFEVKRAPLHYEIESGVEGTSGPLKQMVDQVGLYRSDTLTPLSVVSSRYRVVQPKEIMEFFRDVTDKAGFTMETAGVLYGGRQYWALARIGDDAKVVGQDKIGGYVLLASSCDKSIATVGQLTTIRVVCNNTLRMTLAKGQAAKHVTVPHSSTFSSQLMQDKLGIASDNFVKFLSNAQALASVKLDESAAQRFLVELVGHTNKSVEEQISSKIANATVPAIWKLYDGAGMGSTLEGSAGTLWGLVNGVTEYYDHHCGTNQSARLKSAWFGENSNVKDRALIKAMEIAGLAV